MNGKYQDMKLHSQSNKHKTSLPCKALPLTSAYRVITKLITLKTVLLCSSASIVQLLTVTIWATG